MYVCVTYVDSRTGVPCDLAPMSHGPAFPKLKNFVFEFSDESQWPSKKPLFFGTCDDDADLNVPGVIKALSFEEFQYELKKENHARATEIRKRRDKLLKEKVDSINPMRWEMMSEEEKAAVKEYRTALLNIPQQPGFPNLVYWPKPPK